MTERTTRRTIVLAHAFKLPGVVDMQPPGSYEVETREEQLDGLSFVAWRQLSTTIELVGSTAAMASRQVVEVMPSDLEMVLRRDSSTSGDPELAGMQPDR